MNDVDGLWQIGVNYSNNLMIIVGHDLAVKYKDIYHELVYEYYTVYYFDLLEFSATYLLNGVIKERNVLLQ